MIDFNPVNELLSKPMSRRDFLKHLGMIMVSFIGVGAFVRNIANPLKDVKMTPKKQKLSGYGGSSAYGG